MHTLLYIYAHYAYYCKGRPLKALVLKLGGAALDGAEEALGAVGRLRRDGWAVVIVHGGGREIDGALPEGTPVRRVRGLRVTDQRALAAAEASLCGTVNKALVRACTRLGMRTVGISGQDGGLLRADAHPPVDGVPLGYVGVVREVDPEPVRALLQAGFVPVVAPLAIALDATHAYNVNADAAAGKIAAALAAQMLVMITDVAGLLRDPHDRHSTIASMDVAAAQSFLASSACGPGIQPKLRAVLDALAAGVPEAVICNAHGFESALHHRAGTVIAAA